MEAVVLFGQVFIDDPARFTTSVVGLDETLYKREGPLPTPVLVDAVVDVEHDAVYGQLTRARRRVLHRAVAGWVLDVSGDDPHTAATLAHHLGQADDPRSAAQFVAVCVPAGDEAM